MPKRRNHPENAATHDKPTVTYVDVGCIIHAGVPTIKLQRMQRKPTDDELQFDIKFVRYENGKLTYLSAGGGLPIHLTAKRIRQTASGFYITGIITYRAITAPPQFGTNFNQHRDDVPYDWFQVGHTIEILHRGAAIRGLVISVTDPSSNNKLRLRTKSF